MASEASIGISETLVDKTYDALLTIVRTTAISKRVLTRPPFTFLHKLLVETLSEYGIFSAQQLVFSQLVTKEDKAAFLTRAIAFVTFTMQNAKYQQISCLFFVSPIKILAGLGVEETHEFLQQLCVVCRSNNREAKELAAQEVLTKGDGQLYSCGVAFRKGLLVIQALIRTFIRRRVQKRRAAMGVTTNTESSIEALSTRSDKLSNASAVIEVGTRFQKELPNGLIYNGTIVGIKNKRYQLQYAQNPQSKEEVDEIEMRILLEESNRRLQSQELGLNHPQRVDRSLTRSDGSELLLTGLPDLTPVKEEVSQPQRNSFSRLSSRRPSNNNIEFSAFDNGAKRNQRPSSVSSTRAVSSQKEKPKLEPSLQRSESTPTVELSSSPGFTDEDHSSKPPEENDSIPVWQVSLKQMLERAQAGSEPEGIIGHRKKHIQRQDPSITKNGPSSLVNNNNTTLISHMPTFPQLRIPGQKQLPPVTKRKYPTSGFSSKPLPSPVKSTKEPSSHLETTPQDKSNSRVRRNLGMNNNYEEDKAFEGTMYQSMDPLKSQERMALFREIVHRIDAYMKRKHLRVIDLFRFCDTDGNGSISPQEMMDTLAQLEIHLSIQQAHDFLHHIDKDGNGAIDIDEFEELVRIARRSHAQRMQSIKQSHHVRYQERKQVQHKLITLVKHRQQILNEIQMMGVNENETVYGSQIRSVLVRLQLAGIDEMVIHEFLERIKATGVSMGWITNQTDPSLDPLVHYDHIVSTLHDLEVSTKPNGFLDQSWLTQFDSQLERAYRNFELL